MHHLVVRCLSILKVLFLDTLPSLASTCANIVNSLDMIGYNATQVIKKELDFTQRSGFLDEDLCSSQIRILNSNSSNSSKIIITSDLNDPIWGSLGMALIFIPGIAAAIYGVIVYFQEYKEFDTLRFFAGIFTFLCFPLVHIFLHVRALLHPTDPEIKRSLILGITFQAFFESCPQLTLNGFSLIYEAPSHRTQFATMVLCFLLLIKTAIQFDLVLRNCTSWKQTLHHIFAVLPLYVISCVFRVGSLIIIAAYYRSFATIPIILLPVEFLIIARFLYFDWSNSFILGLSNIGVMSLGYDALSAGGGTVETQPSHMTWYNNKSLKFVKISSLVSCLHLTICLSVLLFHVNHSPDYMEHWGDLVIHSSNCCKYSFNTVLGIFIGLGWVHLLLIRYSVLDTALSSRLRSNSAYSGHNKYNQQQSY